tara:strand:- start:701 stop:1030 length:330 start_codon:yes stop_codon:yes gene_type:complete
VQKGGMMMKITIIIEMKDIKKKRKVEETQPDKERKQSSLIDFDEWENTTTKRYSKDRKGATYKNGRTIHRCSNCGMENRRINHKTGYCAEDDCSTYRFHGTERQSGWMS